MSAKFNLLCDVIGLIEKRYDGSRSRLNLRGYCDRLHQIRNKYIEMVEKAPVEVILYLMAVLAKLADDIEHGRNKSYENMGPSPKELQKAKIVDMIMDRMIEEEKDERERAQKMMQTQIAYAQMVAANLPQMLNGQMGGQGTVNSFPGMAGNPFQQPPFQQGFGPMGGMYGFTTSTTTSTNQTPIDNPLSPGKSTAFLPKPKPTSNETLKKRKPGRPKGAKNKPKTGGSKKSSGKRGRPKGSKNKPQK